LEATQVSETDQPARPEQQTLALEAVEVKPLVVEMVVPD
jgi:hypothetical protein